MGSTKITATPDEINQVCDGVGPTATASNITALTNVKDDLLAAASGPQMSDPITISTADLLALDTVRKQVLASPGAGFVRLVLWVAYRMVPGATPYTIDPSEGIAMRYGAGSATAGPFLDGEVILAATAPFLSTMIGTGYGDLLSAFEDQPITVLATGPITTGNGHLVLTLGYQDVPVA